MCVWCVFSGLCVQFSLPADWFRDQWRICETAEWHCGKVSADRQSQGTKNTHRVHTLYGQDTCTLWGGFVTSFIFCRFYTLMCVCNKLFFTALMFLSWTTCLSSSWNRLNKPGEQTHLTPQSLEKCLHVAGLMFYGCCWRPFKRATDGTSAGSAWTPRFWCLWWTCSPSTRVFMVCVCACAVHGASLCRTSGREGLCWSQSPV